MWHSHGGGARTRLLLAMLCLALAASPASAHGRESTIQLGSERSRPGDTIEVIGDMRADAVVTLTIDSDADGTVSELGSIATGADGHFQAFVELPRDLAAGPYTVEATEGDVVAAARLVIAGSALPQGEEGQLPGQDEALAAGSLEGAPSTAVVQPAASVERLPTQVPAPALVETNSPPIGLAFALVIATIAAMVLAAAMRAKRTKA